MKNPDAFEGSPWGAEPTDDWNCPIFWHDYYRQLSADPDPGRYDRVVHREADLLVRMMEQVGEQPRSLSPKFLDAGCGISLIPHLLAFWGFQVTAIDSCPRAIEIGSLHQPSEEQLARCIRIWELTREGSSVRYVVDDPVRSLQQLRRFQVNGGAVSYRETDWFAAELLPQSFGVIYCRNSLRLATKPYWRRSLSRFHELLVPAGVLLLENVNAIGIQDEVEELLSECGFSPLDAGGRRERNAKYVISRWPTG